MFFVALIVLISAKPGGYDLGLSRTGGLVVSSLVPNSSKYLGNVPFLISLNA